MRIYDVTVPVSEQAPVYEGDPAVSFETPSTIAGGDSANVSKMCFCVHTGTHVDAPNHFIDGTRRVEDLEIEKLIGPCRVVEISEEVDEIGPEQLGGLGGVERVIFKTKNSTFWNEPEKGFRTDFTHLLPDAAELLVSKGVKLIGIDYLSIEKFTSTGFETHKILLENEVVILEGVDLREVPPGEYELICLPMKFVGGKGDGAPARTLLRSFE